MHFTFKWHTRVPQQRIGAEQNSSVRIPQMAMFLYLTVLMICVTTAISSVASDHECNRHCKIGQRPKTCVYNFTVEWYRTLSKACHNCPFVQEDCYRPHCVSADGKVRAFLAVNRKMPGPSIEVCEDDTVVVYLTNMLEDGGTISLHSHGIHQYKTPYMDGAAHVTQCGITEKETFRYEFKASPAGTHWYHSHSGMQIADGFLGAFIVRKPVEIDPSHLLYEEDRSDHIIVVNDWLPVTSLTRYVDLMHDAFDISLPISSLVNGKAHKFNVTSRDPSQIPTQTPLEVFNVEANMTYRFRVIGASATCPMKLSIDSHRLTIIASDGMPVSPVEASTVLIHPGERYDFVLRTNQPVDNYVMRFRVLSDCRVNKEMVFAMLHYNGSNTAFPAIDPTVSESGVFVNPVLISDGNPHYSHGDELDINVDELRSERFGHLENYTTEHVDLVYFIASDYNNNDNTKYNHPEYYPVKTLPPFLAHYTPVLDNITFDIPPIPPLSQSEDIRPEWFCNQSTVDMTACREDLCICTHMISLKLHQVVDLVVVNEGKTFTEVGHPMHLHGHSFRVLGLTKVNESTSVSEIRNLEKQGKLERNLINPPWKDTVNVPDGGYVVLRIITDNPGYWFFHCHIDSHLVQGMAMLIRVGEESDLPPVPDQFPRCGGMGFSNAAKPVPPEPIILPCNAASGTHSLYILYIATLFLLFHILI